MASAVLVAIEHDLFVYRLTTSAGTLTVPLSVDPQRAIADNERAGFVKLRALMAEGLEAIERMTASQSQQMESWPLGDLRPDPLCKEVDQDHSPASGSSSVGTAPNSRSTTASSKAPVAESPVREKATAPAEVSAMRRLAFGRARG